MVQVVHAFMRWFQELANFLDRQLFQYNNLNISIFDIYIVFMVLALVASVFWRGTRT